MARKRNAEGSRDISPAALRAMEQALGQPVESLVFDAVGTIGLCKVDTDAVGRELFAIFLDLGELPNEAIVERARDPESALHPLFEWDVEKAALAHWCRRASTIANAVRVQVHWKDRRYKPTVFQAFASISHQAFKPERKVQVDVSQYTEPEQRTGIAARQHRVFLPTAMADPDMRDDLLASALEDLRQLREKYKKLEALKPVMTAIDRLLLQYMKRRRRARGRKRSK